MSTQGWSLPWKNFIACAWEKHQVQQGDATKLASGKAFVSQLKLTTCEDKGCRLFQGTNKAQESVWLTEESSSDTLGTRPLLSSFKSGPSSPGVFPNRPPPCSKNAGSWTQCIQVVLTTTIRMEFPPASCDTLEGHYGSSWMQIYYAFLVWIEGLQGTETKNPKLGLINQQSRGSSCLHLWTWLCWLVTFSHCHTILPSGSTPLIGLLWKC